MKNREWLLTKILNYLRIREGFQIELTDCDENATVRDAFGYRYEINLRLIGRTQLPREILEIPDSYDFLEDKKS